MGHNLCHISYGSRYYWTFNQFGQNDLDIPYYITKFFQRCFQLRKSSPTEAFEKCTFNQSLNNWLNIGKLRLLLPNLHAYFCVYQSYNHECQGSRYMIYRISLNFYSIMILGLFRHPFLQWNLDIYKSQELQEYYRDDKIEKHGLLFWFRYQDCSFGFVLGISGLYTTN